MGPLTGPGCRLSCAAALVFAASIPAWAFMPRPPPISGGVVRPTGLIRRPHDGGLEASAPWPRTVLSSSSRTEILDDDAFTNRAEWRRLNDIDIAFPPFFSEPKGIVHFVGGAVVGSLPSVAYGPLIERLAQKGFCVVATPIPFSVFDHNQAASEAVATFQRGMKEVEKVYGARVVDQVPTFGVGHSLGSKIHVLLGSQGDERLVRHRRANVLISFNNFSAKESVPLLEELRKLGATVGAVGGMDVTQQLGDLTRLLGGVLGDEAVNSFAKQGLNMALNIISAVSAIPADFQPDPPTTWRLIEDDYAVQRNLVIQFDKDTIDQSDQLSFKLTRRFPGGDRTRALKLQGTHITPNTPEAVMRDDMGARGPAASSYVSQPGGTVTALGPVMELRRTWFAEAGVEEVTRAAAQAAKRELEGLAMAITDYLTEMAALPPDAYGSLGPGR